MKAFSHYSIIPEMKDVNVIAFHANKNRKIDEIEPGEISTDIIRPAENGWTFFNPSLKLKVGDKINYWIFIQHNSFGYKKPGQSWVVNGKKQIRV